MESLYLSLSFYLNNKEKNKNKNKKNNKINNNKKSNNRLLKFVKNIFILEVIFILNIGDDQKVR